nr:hypothetical protein [Burkholderia pyrrocinia]
MLDLGMRGVEPRVVLYLVNRYSERKESAEELSRRVNQASIRPSGLGELRVHGIPIHALDVSHPRRSLRVSGHHAPPRRASSFHRSAVTVMRFRRRSGPSISASSATAPDAISSS